jgi:hypothetical protein
MIINPDFFIVGGFAISGLLTSFVFYYLEFKVPLWKNILYSLAFFIVCICISIHLHDRMENRLKSLRQTVYIKYKHDKVIKTGKHSYGKRNYFTVIFDNKCVGDIVVDEESYKKFKEGDYINVTPTYFVYYQYLRKSCESNDIYVDDNYDAKVMYKRVQLNDNGKFIYKMGFKYPNGCVYEKNVSIHDYQNIVEGAIIRSNSNIKYDYNSIKSKQCN